MVCCCFVYHIPKYAKEKSNLSAGTSGDSMHPGNGSWYYAYSICFHPADNDLFIYGNDRYDSQYLL